MNVLKTSSYANYRIDDIDYEERADDSLDRCQQAQDCVCNTKELINERAASKDRPLILQV